MSHLKLLGVAMVAALALSAVAATSAFATYHSEIKTTNIKGSQQGENILKTKVGNAFCTTATFNESNVVGTEKAAGDFTTETLMVKPLYGKATGSGSCKLAGLAVNRTTTGCTFTFTKATATEKQPEKGKTNHAVVHIECETGKEIVIEDVLKSGCIVTIPAQITGGVLMFTNLNEGKGKEREIEAEFELSGIKYSWTAACPNAEKKSGSAEDGTYTGNARIKGENPSGGAQVGVWVE